MNKLFDNHPWLRSAGCGVLIAALVLSVCLPLMGMRTAEPDNPILQAEPQAITVLQAGTGPGGPGAGDGTETSGSGAGGGAASSRRVFMVETASRSCSMLLGLSR